ncbi:C-type lectin BML-1-like [Mizuhopecten yessoensis]|uniref:C-type lectin BML-1-like n=1 Tax=Mizuhopecten yessoensis TaxID=6573 RepID=UPI000B45823E|nr:C-type lectin BML-1-like [Mizuhopecten yessoensis]
MTEIWQTRDIGSPVQVCGDVISVLDDISPIQCAIYCMDQVHMCFMFEFNVTTNVCSIYSEISYQNETQSSQWTPFLALKGPSNCERSGYDHVVNEGLCFKIFEEEVTWYDASRTCEEDKGRLVVLKNSRQIEALLKHAEGYPIWQLWSGLTDPAKDGIWKWVDNTPFNSSVWHLILFNGITPHYPADPFTADCASIYTYSDYLHDNNCKSIGGFVCERPQLL